MKRIALVVAVATFVVAWAGGGSGTVGRWLTLIGLLASERFAALAMPRASRAKVSAPVYPFR